MVIRAGAAAVGTLGVVMLLSTGCVSAPRDRRVNSLSHVQLGGIKQAVLERGAHEGLPILLWLHGGPGAAQMPLAHRYNTELEESFIVVHWDQRGAGKSNPQGFDEGTMTLDQFVRDAQELTLHLKAKHQQDRIFLLGHSWGTKIGLLLARDHPEEFHAFIAVSQVVDPARAQSVAYQWLGSRLQERNHRRALRTLDRLGTPPYEEHPAFVEFMGMVDRYGGGMDVGFMPLLCSALTSPYYRWRDYPRWLNGARRGSGPMWEQYGEFSAIEQVPRVEIPVHFISGSRDMNTPVQLVREYFEALDAPLGKGLHIIDDAAHAPFLGNPAEFRRILEAIASEGTELFHHGDRRLLAQPAGESQADARDLAVRRERQ